MQATHINAKQGSLLVVLGTTMQLGYGPVQTSCTARAQCTVRRHENSPAPFRIVICLSQSPNLLLHYPMNKANEEIVVPR